MNREVQEKKGKSSHGSESTGNMFALERAKAHLNEQKRIKKDSQSECETERKWERKTQIQRRKPALRKATQSELISRKKLEWGIMIELTKMVKSKERTHLNELIVGLRVIKSVFNLSGKKHRKGTYGGLKWAKVSSHGYPKDKYTQT